MLKKGSEIVIGLAGNPNTGKSTVFNCLTGLKQHTGNWSGKTVTNAKGSFVLEDMHYVVYDLPGIYSLFSDSAEECCAKEFICSAKTDVMLIVLDATSLERNLTLVLHILELTERVILCVNLMDEAKKKGIIVDDKKLEKELGIPVICTSARSGKGIEELKKMIVSVVNNKVSFSPNKTVFSQEIEEICNDFIKQTEHIIPEGIDRRYFAMEVLEGDEWFLNMICGKLDDIQMAEVLAREEYAEHFLEQSGYTREKLKEEKTITFLERGQCIAKEVVTEKTEQAKKRERFLDNLFLSKKTGIPVMIALLGIVFWITIAGANIPSNLLMELFCDMGEKLGIFLKWCAVPDWLYGIVKDGIFLTVSWVVAVMLPPMAIFFPLFTLLEDFGLLPRIAFHMDGLFQKAHAHGKQALTMCMGFGCNSAAVTACRIIDSPRERLIAIITNNFVPCNGRLPQPLSGKNNINIMYIRINKTELKKQIRFIMISFFLM